MRILGIMWEENSTAALLVDGAVVACASEERFSREKNDERYPKRAVEYCLREGGIRPSELDAVAFCGTIWTPEYTLTRRYSRGSVSDALREQKEYWYPRLYEHKSPSYLGVFRDRIDTNQYPFQWDEALSLSKKQARRSRDSREVIKFFQKFRREAVAKHLSIDPKKIHFIDHHTAHAHYAYFSGPLRRDALVLTADAWGDNLNATVSVARGGALRRIFAYDRLILAHLYRYVTLLLGMKPNEHEYKVMGLAPYAKENYLQSALKVFTDTQFVRGMGFGFKTIPPDRYFYFKEKLDGERFDVVAGALQRYTETTLVEWLHNCMRKTGLHDVCFGGGVAMNVKASMEMQKLRGVRSFFVPPSPGDESQAIGSAQVLAAELYCARGEDPRAALQPLQNTYLGPAISDEDARRVIARARKSRRYRIIETATPDTVARLLAEGKIIGRAALRSEFGARALGNRSILADPRNYDIVRVINEKVKNRDFWMPFAATILERRAADYLIGYHPEVGAPYMTLAFETTPLAWRDLRAGLHPADRTCRPQVLKPGVNPEYEAITRAFEKRTGVGGLLNTSFNLHGEPIVQTAADAYRVFLLSGIDGLLLNRTLILKK